MIIFLRCVYTATILIVGFFTPWWFVVILLALGMALFRNYIEAFVIAGILDIAYTSPTHDLFRYVYMTSVFVLYILMHVIRKRLL